MILHIHIYTYTYTRIYIKADLQKHLSYSEVPSFEKFSEWTILGSFFLFNLGKMKQFPSSSKHPLPIISSPFSRLSMRSAGITRERNNGISLNRVVSSATLLHEGHLQPLSISVVVTLALKISLTMYGVYNPSFCSSHVGVSYQQQERSLPPILHSSYHLLKFNQISW